MYQEHPDKQLQKGHSRDVSNRRYSGNSRCTRNIRTSDSSRVTAGMLVIEGTPATADVPGTSGQATAVGSQQRC